MIGLSTATLALEFTINVLFGVCLAEYDPFFCFTLILLCIPCLPMGITSLIGGVSHIKNPVTRKRAITTTIISGVALNYVIVLAFLIAFAFGTGGRLPSPQLFGWW